MSKNEYKLKRTQPGSNLKNKKQFLCNEKLETIEEEGINLDSSSEDGMETEEFESDLDVLYEFIEKCETLVMSKNLSDSSVRKRLQYLFKALTKEF